MKLPLLTALLLLALPLSAATAAAPPPYVAAALADPSRSPAAVAADAIRDPADTLAFAGVKPGMVVGELFPGGGYFTRLLSDIVGPTGKVYALENAGWKSSGKADQALIAQPGRGNIVLDIEPFSQFKPA